MIPTDKHVISTQTNCYNHYLKDDKIICFGLNEDKKPSTLCNPRPTIRIKRSENLLENTEFNDDNMNIVLQKFKPNQILVGCFNKELVFTVDLENDVIQIEFYRGYLKRNYEIFDEDLKSHDENISLEFYHYYKPF